MKTISVTRLFLLWLGIIAVMVLSASLAMAQETTEEVIISDEISESEGESLDIFVSEEALLTPSSIVLLDTEQSSTTEDVNEPTEETEIVESQSAGVIESTPELTTDKDDYHPGETATIFGKFFAPLQTFLIKVFGSDEGESYTETEEEITADEDGTFVFSYLLDNLYRPFYEVVVATLSGETVAETWFRDAAVDAYDQCSNNLGTGYTTGNTGCRWINGAINGNNSVYQEGDATVQRLSLDGFAPGSTHTVTIQYGTTKQGKHAYDFLTTWNHSENWISVADRCDGIAGCTTASETTLPIPSDPNGSGQFEGTVGARNFVMRGGTLNSATAPTLSGSYAGDSETSITISFTVPNSGPLCGTQGQVTSCGVVLWFGAHIAKTSDWMPFNGTTGATSISGAPYHVAITALDGGSIGNRDNQMQASAVPGQIIIVKDAVPNTAQDFSFTTTGNGLSNFSLDDDDDGTLSNTKTFILSGSGTFTVTEAVASGYSLSNLVCSDPTANSSVNLGTRTATINLAAGETVTCTFTNTLQQGTLTLVKTVTNDNGGGAVAGDWTLSADGPTPISGTTGSGAVTNAPVNAGVYTLSESAGPAGYTAGSWSCPGATLNGNQVTVPAGQNVTCTINNNDNAPSLTLVKQVINDNGGEAVPGDWNLTASGYDIQSPDAGTYNLSETGGPDGYAQTSLTCSNSGNAQVTSVTLGLGENVTCTFVNDDIPGTISGHKFEDKNGNGTWDDGEPALSGWTINLNGDDATDVTDANGFYEFTDLSVGNYTISETQQAGWEQTTANPAPITITNGQTVEDVDFGNFKLVSITGKKYNDDEGDGAIAGDATLPGWTIRLYDTSNNPWTLVDTQVTDGTGSYTFNNVPVGSYKVCEVLQTGWVQTFSSTGSVNNTSPSTATEGQKCNTKNITTSGTNPSAGNFGNYQIKALEVSKTATTAYTRTHNWDITKSVDVDTVDLFTGDSETVNYDVTVTKTGFTDSGWTVSGTIAITNPNPVATGLTASISDIVDSISNQGNATVTCPGGLAQNLSAGATLNCTYTKAVSDGDDENNTVTVSTTGSVPGGQGQAAVDFGEPTNVVNNTINVIDTYAGVLGGASETKTFEYPRTLTCDNEGKVPNTATITETEQEASAEVTVTCYDLTVTKTADTTYTRTFNWDINKSVDENALHLFKGDSDTVEYTVEVTKDEGTDSDFEVTGTITVTNPAPMDATLASVTDVLTGDIAATVNCPSMVVPADDSIVCTYSSDLPNATERTNTATAELDNGTKYTGTADVTFKEPETTVNDTVDVEDLLDTNLEKINEEISGSETFTYEHTYTCDADEGAHKNTATVTGSTGVLGSGEEMVTVSCYDLTVTKTANTSFKKTWTWDIDKTSTTSVLNLAPGQTYPVYYEVSVTAEPTDSDWAVAGTITIVNSAPMPAVLSDVKDMLPTNIEANVNCPAMTVPANDSLVCSYTAVLPSASNLVNTAEVTTDNGTIYTGTADVSFVGATMTEIDESIEVTDDKYGALGTVLASDTLPKVFKYTQIVGPYLATACGTTQQFDNTAELTTNDSGTKADDTVTVDVNVRCTCSLTQGYWKTHNDTFHGGAPADENWFNLPGAPSLGENTLFFGTGATWYTTFWTAPKGNVYYNLAHQYMAAKLNVLNGAHGPTIAADIVAAELLFNTYTPAQLQKLKGKTQVTVSKQFTDLAGKLAAFNEGKTNPAGHCTEIPQ
jgi:hypothetical protein